MEQWKVPLIYVLYDDQIYFLFSQYLVIKIFNHTE